MANATAILTQANRVTIQKFNAAGTMVEGAIYTLQATKIKPSKKQPRIPFTNTESPPRRRDFAPGNQEGNFNIDGIVDVGGNFDALWTDVMDGALFAQVVYYLAKPAAGLNPLAYTCKTLFENIEIDSEIAEDGSVMKFTATGYLLGSFVKTGLFADLTYVTGAAS